MIQHSRTPMAEEIDKSFSMTLRYYTMVKLPYQSKALIWLVTSSFYSAQPSTIVVRIARFSFAQASRQRETYQFQLAGLIFQMISLNVKTSPPHNNHGKQFKIYTYPRFLRTPGLSTCFPPKKVGKIQAAAIQPSRRWHVVLHRPRYHKLHEFVRSAQRALDHCGFCPRRTRWVKVNFSEIWPMFDGKCWWDFQ